MPIWLGIDIGRSAVKVAAIRSAYRRTTLEGLARVDVGVGEDGTPAVGVAMRSAVEAVLATIGAPDAVAVAVDGARATVRMVTLPAGAIKQVAEVLPFELEALIPFDLGESVFDYRALARPARLDDGEAAGVPLIVGVARTDEVVKQIALAREATGLEPERVAVGALPLANVMAILPPEAGGDKDGGADGGGPVVVIDLGARTSDVLILSRGEPVFARTLSQGTERIRVDGAAPRARDSTDPWRVPLVRRGAARARRALRRRVVQAGRPRVPRGRARPALHRAADARARGSDPVFRQSAAPRSPGSPRPSGSRWGSARVRSTSTFARVPWRSSAASPGCARRYRSSPVWPRSCW